MNNDAAHLSAPDTSAQSSPAQLIIALALASHPLPTIVVTAFAGLLAVVAQQPITTTLTVVIAVAFGQLVIGWSNDLLDRDRDALDGRRGKPASDGRLTPLVLRRAIAVAAVLTILATVLLGPVAALAHALVVTSGVAYNVRAKRAASSWLPFALAFGALPTVAFTASPPWVSTWSAAWSAAPEGPPGWVTACGALLGVSAHLVNAAPDVDDDLAHGIRGLPQRLGGGRAVGLALLLLAAATTIGVRATQGPNALLVGACGAALAGVGLLVRPPAFVPRWAFLVVLALIIAVVSTVALGV